MLSEDIYSLVQGGVSLFRPQLRTGTRSLHLDGMESLQRLSEQIPHCQLPADRLTVGGHSHRRNTSMEEINYTYLATDFFRGILIA